MVQRDHSVEGSLVSSSITRFCQEQGFEPVLGARTPDGSSELAPEHHPVWIDLEQVTTRCGFSYAAAGWHPYTAAVREYASGAESRAADSVLAQYLATFVPSSAGDAIMGPDADPLPVLHDLPVYPLDFVKRIWELDANQVAELRAGAEDGPPTWGNPHYGPASSAWVAAEYERLTSIYQSIADRGYQPTQVEDGFVRGYFLVRDGAFRFVALEGNHRLGALRALGVEQVAVVPWRALPIIHERDFDAPDSPVGNYLPAWVAHRLFDVLFETTGMAKAERLGLA